MPLRAEQSYKLDKANFQPRKKPLLSGPSAKIMRPAVTSVKKFRAIPHNSKCRYGERSAADAKPKAQIILDAAKVSAASGRCSEPKQGQRSQSARGFCPRSTMRVPQPDIIEHFGLADAVPQPPERCLSRKAGIVRCCLRFMPVRGVGDAAPITNLLVRYTFLMKNRIRPRRGWVTPPYREFTGL